MAHTKVIRYGSTCKQDAHGFFAAIAIGIGIILCAALTTIF